MRYDSACAVVCIFVLLLFFPVSAMHGQRSPAWIEDVTDQQGNSCCGKRDCIAAAVRIIRCAPDFCVIELDGEQGIVDAKSVVTHSHNAFSYVCAAGHPPSECWRETPDGRWRLRLKAGVSAARFFLFSPDSQNRKSRASIARHFS